MLITVDFGAQNSGASVFYRLLNADKTVAVARTSTGVTELVASTGIYGVEVTDATLRGKTAIWDVDGTALAASETFPDWPAMIRTELATELGRIDVATSTRLATASYTSPPSASTVATAVRSELTVELGRIDAAVSSRLPTATYTAPPSASTVAGAVRIELATELATLDVAVSSRLATASYTAPANADVAAIKAKTDSLAFTVAGKVDANIVYVANRQVVGTGVAGDPWGPAP